MGAAIFGAKAVNPKKIDKDLRPICRKLNMSLEEAERLLEKFQDIDRDSSGCISTDEFFAFISMEATPFARKLFSLIDQNDSGEIDFNEFLVGLWNVCTFDDESLLRFAFNMIDKDSSGYVDKDEVEQCVKDVHGSRYDRRLTAHIKKTLKKYDKNKDGQFSFDEFKSCHKELPLLFMPAFSMKNVMMEEFYGEKFWKGAAKARKRDKVAQDVREFMAWNKKLQQEQAYAQLYGDEGGGGKKHKPRAPPKEHKEVWEKSEDKQVINLQDAEQAKMKKKNAKEKRRDRIHADASGVKRFSLDAEERFGLNDDKAPIRQDVRRQSIDKKWKPTGPKADTYEGPGGRRASVQEDESMKKSSIAQEQIKAAKAKRRSSVPENDSMRKQGFGAKAYGAAENSKMRGGVKGDWW